MIEIFLFGSGLTVEDLSSDKTSIAGGKPYYYYRWSNGSFSKYYYNEDFSSTVYGLKGHFELYNYYYGIVPHLLTLYTRSTTGFTKQSDSDNPAFDTAFAEITLDEYPMSSASKQAILDYWAQDTSKICCMLRNGADKQIGIMTITSEDSNYVNGSGKLYMNWSRSDTWSYGSAVDATYMSKTGDSFTKYTWDQIGRISAPHDITLTNGNNTYTFEVNPTASQEYQQHNLLFTPTSASCSLKLDLSGMQGSGIEIDVKDIGVYEIGGDE